MNIEFGRIYARPERVKTPAIFYRSSTLTDALDADEVGMVDLTAAPGDESFAIDVDYRYDDNWIFYVED